MILFSCSAFTDASSLAAAFALSFFKSIFGFVGAGVDYATPVVGASCVGSGEEDTLTS